MKNLRILQVAFDTNIQPYELPYFRGAIAPKVGIKHAWFYRNTPTNGACRNLYPLMSYKLNTYKGQLHPLLLCLDEALYLFAQGKYPWLIRSFIQNNY